jgi:hypothetical protein
MIEKPLQVRGLCHPPRLPDFLGIGAQKSGTTWLHAQLSTHPALLLPEEKEVHYFDWKFHRPLVEYGRHFLHAGDRVAGEITPGYAILPDDRIRFVARIMPRLRILYLMRDPVERAWSQVVMNEIELGGAEPSAIDDDGWIRRLREHRVRRRGDHLAVIDAWRRHVPEERMFLGFFEDIGGDPAGLLASVHRFLGVEARPPAETGVVRRGVRIEMPERVREGLVEMLEPELRAMADRFGDPCRRWLARWTS